MDIYGKVFKKYVNNKLEVFYKHYKPDIELYHELIENSLKLGERQIIINSEIMLEIMYRAVEQDNIIMGIKMSENTDNEITSSISNVIKNIKTNKLEFIKLKELLNWSNTNDSIDISSVDIYFGEKLYTITVEGIFYCNHSECDFSDIFNSLIKESIEKKIL
ncbi:hypothetical protein [Tenuibacillus multivorans]|uniref:Uncharacterized protein n=1 Tax=Tenuibacillus multivorans TaxID=237069 RepID=A0A1H0DEZ2_9BACI|nr:hypothetical protein [Tenuibacillus multivorans]GEL76579.1 hypothetical protein TMU01_08140 [Tenuibacillus multivorans]SDN68730.1 hypothetical protein SAMN05216498_2846 [Tenuibacillus multivorans]